MTYRPGVDYAPHIRTQMNWPASLFTPWPMEVCLSKCLIPRANHSWIDYNMVHVEWKLSDCTVSFYIEDDTYRESLYAFASI